MVQIEEREQLQEENRRLREANQNWQECVRESLEAVNHHNSWPLFHHNRCHSQGSENREVFLHVPPV